MQNTLSPSQPNRPDLPAARRTLWLALALGWVADQLFYGQQLGISVLLFVGLLLVSLWANGRSAALTPRNRWLILPLLFFASMVFIRANPFLTFLNTVATLCLLAVVAFFYAAGQVSSLTTLGLALLPLRVAGNAVVHTPPLLAQTINPQAAQLRGRQNLLPLLRGALLALPVLAVFTALLSSADLAFANVIETIFAFDFLPDLATLMGRGLFILVMAWMVAGGLAYALARREADKLHVDDRGLVEIGADWLRQRFPLGFVETATVLGLVDGLFLLFTAVQFTYLFGGRRNIGDFTYAEYARRGFFELVLVAVLSLGLILGLHWLAQRANKQQIGWFNVLSSLMVGFVLVMLVSAWRRMMLYEATFGYTEMRLIVFVFIGWLALLLGWFLLTLWRQPERFAIGLLLCVIGFVATLNLLNTDALIVRRNLAHYEQTGELDVYYLVGLSADAVPMLVVAETAVAHDPQTVTDWNCGRDSISATDDVPPECQVTLATILARNLDARHEELTPVSYQTWPSFNLSRHQAYLVLKEREG